MNGRERRERVWNEGLGRGLNTAVAEGTVKRIIRATDMVAVGVDLAT